MLKSYEAIYTNNQLSWLSSKPDVDNVKVLVIFEENVSNPPVINNSIKSLYYQSDYKNIKWTTVRMIKSSELLIIEYLLVCLLSSEEYAQKLAYYATVSYVEEYDASVGTGLIAKSIPMLEDVVAFWRRKALN